MAAVFDASALLAVIFGEPGADAAIGRLAAPGGAVSAVNWAEVATKMADRGTPGPDIAAELQHLGLEVVPLDAELALQTAALRGETRTLGLSLGDRSCLALARQLDADVITADKAWAALQGFRIVLIR